MSPKAEQSRRAVGKGADEDDDDDDEEEALVSDVVSPGPFSVSTRVGIMAALLGFRRTTFTELLLAVKTPKSSLNKNLGVLEDYGFIKQRRSLLFGPGPRTIIEITPEGVEATKRYLELMRSVADRFLDSTTTTADPARGEEEEKEGARRDLRTGHG